MRGREACLWTCFCLEPFYWISKAVCPIFVNVMFMFGLRRYSSVAAGMMVVKSSLCLEVGSRSHHNSGIRILSDI